MMSEKEKNRRIGVWLIGAYGSISTAVVMGALALGKGLIPATGLVTAGETFDGLELVDMGDFVFGGCDIRQGSLVDGARHIVAETVGIDPDILKDIDEDVHAVERNIVYGTTRNCGDAIEKLSDCPAGDALPLRDEIEKLRQMLRHFMKENSVHEAIVVNLASTEPPIDLQYCHGDLTSFEACIDNNNAGAVAASTLYAYAAIQEGCPFINFTPSNGALIPALVQLAEKKGVPAMGNDGKTGETLVKSALAPMFLQRNLDVLSWEGFNILGNMDGRVLNHPENRESKIKTKDHILQKILGYAPHSRVRIDYVPSLDDQKTAWDFVHFQGFLGGKMSLQFTWQGYDSLLAAPLVLDLVRLAELAKRRKEAGLMPQLASFFKAPLGVEEHSLFEQFQILKDYARGATVLHGSVQKLRQKKNTT